MSPGDLGKSASCCQIRNTAVIQGRAKLRVGTPSYQYRCTFINKKQPCNFRASVLNLVALSGHGSRYLPNQLNSTTKFSSSMYTGYETAVITVIGVSIQLCVYTHSSRHAAGAEFSMFDPHKIAFWRGKRLRNGLTMVRWCGRLQLKR